MYESTSKILFIFRCEVRGWRLEDVRRWKMNRPPLCCWADPASMGAARVTEVKNDINMACQCVIYYIYWNIYYRAVRFLSKKMIIRCSSWKNKYCFYLSQNNLVAIEVFKMLCFVNFEKIEVFQVLRLPPSPAGKHKISKLFHFFCFSFRGQSWVHFILHHAPFQLNFFSTEFCHVTLIVDAL